MKKLAIIIALLVTSLALGADCPKISIRGPCLTAEELTAAVKRGCPQPPGLKCPDVDLSGVLAAIKGIKPTCNAVDCNVECGSVQPPAAPPVKPHGRFFIPLSLARLDGYSNRSSYVETVPHGHPEDPSISVSHDAVWGVGGGLGYQWANGVSLSGQYLFLESGSASVRFAHAPDSRLEAHGLRVEGNAPRGLWLATVTIPFGKR